MLTSSVGKKARNKTKDVKTIQQIFNLRSGLRKELPKLVVDGRFGEKTQIAIDQMQARVGVNPDGRISPYKATIKKIWPKTYGKPTGYAVRGTDSYGSGHHGASRGSRVHDGTDFNSTAGQDVKAPLSGKVTKLSKPYTSGIDATVLSGVEIVASDGTTCWVWYIKPSTNIIGKVVKAGSSVIGEALTLKNRYKKGITDHVHVRIHTKNGTKIDPSTVIK